MWRGLFETLCKNPIVFSVKVTLRDILKNEPLLSAYLSETFRMTPSTVSDIISSNLDLGKLVSMDYM